MKARRLKRLRIRRVDLVERGANQEADVVLFKADDMKPDEMMRCKKCNHEMKADAKVCPECGAEMKKAAQAAEEKLMAENTELIKKLQDDLKAATDLAEEEAKKRESVEKSLKEQGENLTALKKRLDEAENAAKLAEFKKTVDAFEHLPVQTDVFAPILKKCSEALDEAGYTELMRVLKAADVASASNFRELGAPGNDTNPRSATAEINAKVKELVEKGMKMPEALTQVMAENPKLAARARREAYSKSKAEEEE